jgi:ribosomal silencing factor RsfS
VRLQDVIGMPSVTTVEELRDSIKSMLDTFPPAPDSGIGDATAENQVEQITQLNVISQTLLDMKILMTANSSLNEASRIDESVPYVVYKGFAMPSTEGNAAAWAIQKISRQQDIIVYEWADGNNQFDNVWDNRYSLTYLPLLNGAG